MSNTIDERVVEAKFDNNQFLRGVKSTLDSLNTLKTGLNLTGASRGINDVANGVNRLADQFHVMRIAATTAISTIAHQLTIAGEQFVKSFTVGPLMDGLHEYETQLGSIQTILSNTQWQHTSLKQVNAALAELNHYSDKTIYNFGEMARNIGTFTAAGVKLDTSVAAIKGIANLAAVSGSNAQQASTAMYQLSQALSSGTVKLMDWNSVVNAGMGGKVFQDSLLETARVHGVAVDKMIKKDGSFRNTLQRGWLTSKILTETLAKFTGDESREQLKQQGYTEKQINQIEKLGKMATDAATKVKTGTQLINTLQETAGSGWAKTWQIVIGNFNEAKDLWTGVNNVVGGGLTRMAKARNKVLSEWKDLGGRDALIEGIKNTLAALGSVLKPIKDAFRDIFPKKTGEQLYQMTVSFRDFMERLKIGADTADNLRRTFAGLFAVLDIGWQIVKAGVHFILDLFGAITKGEGSGGFLGATANIGDFLVALDNAVKKGQGLTKFFEGLEHILAGPIRLLKAVAAALFSVFDFNAPSADKITSALNPIENLGQALTTIWDHLFDIFVKVLHFAMRIGATVGRAFAGMGVAISKAMGGLNFEDVLHTINTGLLAGIVLLIKKFVDHFTRGGSPMQGIVDAIKSPFTELTGTLQQMQHTLRATTLLQIAAAVGILAASVIGLSRIDTAGLTRALTAIAGLFTQLFVSLALFSKIGGPQGLIAAGAGLILFATAIRVLTSSVKALSGLSWQDLAKGISGVTALIAGLVLATRGMAGNAGGMIRAGAGLILLAAAIKILVSAVTDLSGLSWGEMAQGLTGVAAVLTALTLYSKFAGANGAGVLSGAGLVLLASAIKILADAVDQFSKLSWGQMAKGLTSVATILVLFAAFSKGVGNPVTLLASGAALILIGHAMNSLADAIDQFAKNSWGQIAKGLVSMAGALTLIVLAMNAMPVTSLLSAAALVGVAIALGQIADALGQMGGMSWGEIAKGLVTLAGSLTIIAAAMYAMSGTLAGAAATLVVAAALRVLVPVITTLGGMSWGSIAKGLITLAAAFTIIGVAGLVLTPIIPSLLGLGASVALLGAGMALAGAGVLLFATGLTALATAGLAATAAIIGIVTGLLGAIPGIAVTLGLALVAIAKAVGAAGPAIIKALTVILDGLLRMIAKESPKIIKTFGQMMIDLLKEMEKAIPKMANSALKMMIGILDALQKKEPTIVAKMIDLIVGLLNALAHGVPKMATAATNLMVSFLEGIAKHIDEVITAGTDIIIAWIKGIGKNAVRIANAAMDTIVDFVNGLADAIESHTDDFRDAGKHMAFAIADGLTLGLASKVKDVAGKAEDMAKGAYHKATGWLGIHSPSKKFEDVGKWSALGFALGIKAYADVSANASKDMVKGALEGATKEFRDMIKFVIFDLPKGLVGGKDEITQTLQNAKTVLHSAAQQSHADMQQLKQDLKELKQGRDDDNKAVRDAAEAQSDAKKKLDELLSAKKQDHEAIVQAQRDLRDATEKLHEAEKAQKEHEQAIKDDTKALEHATNQHKLAKDAFDELNDKLDTQKQKLKELGAEYDAETEKLNAANQVLQDAINLRDNYNSQITDQYSALPDITAETTPEEFDKNLQDQVDNTAKFIADLNVLRDQFHLSDEMYKELLAKGPEILPFVEQLVSGGQAAVDQINTLTDQLTAEATTLGKIASATLYQAGVDAAQGIVNGIKHERKHIREEMEEIANIIAKAIRKALKIKSPSEVMHDHGVNIMQGLINGIRSQRDALDSLVDRIGQRIVSAMASYVAQVQAMAASADVSSKIAPVVTLPTQKTVAPVTATQPTLLTINTTPAKNTSSELSAVRNLLATQAASGISSSTSVTFIQNNTSPKALSSAEIYRQTNNQISLAKEALTNAA